MFYYKITGKLKDEKIAEKINDGDFFNNDREKLRLVSDDFFEKSESNSYFFMGDVSRKGIVIGLICKDNERVDNEIHEYILNLDLEVSDIEYMEITFRELLTIIRKAERSGFIGNPGDILGAFEIDTLDNIRHYGTCFVFTEHIIKADEPDQILNSTRCFMIKDSLQTELDRIVSGKKKKHVAGHPVHYLIRTDDKEESVDIAKVLVGALYANNRLYSKETIDYEFSREEYWLNPTPGDQDPL